MATPKIGYAAMLEQFGPQEVVGYSATAEQHGFTGVMAADHFQPWVPQQGNAAFVWNVMTAIAERAGASVETIYGAYGSKSGLFRALVDVAMRGDEDPVPFVERESVQAIIAERDPRRQLEMYGAVLADVQPRLAPLARSVRDAAASNPDLAEAWDTLRANRLDGMNEFARHLGSRGALRLWKLRK